MKRLLVLSIFILANHLTPAQDPIGEEILKFNTAKPDLIKRGRLLVEDRFAAADRSKVSEVVDYLIELEAHDDYLAFYPAERWMLWYWTGQYDKVLDEVTHFNESTMTNLNRKVRPPSDALQLKLQDYFHGRLQEVRDQVMATELPLADREFLVLNIMYLMASPRSPEITQAGLNAESDRFLSAHPNTAYDQYVRRYLRFVYRPSRWGFGVEFFSGYGVATGQLATAVTSNVPFGVAFDVTYDKFVVYLRDHIAVCKTDKDLTFPAATWLRGAHAEIFLPEISLGFAVLDRKRWQVAPFLGYGGASISPTTNDKKKYPAYENVGLDFVNDYVVGLNVDRKMGLRNNPSTEGSYWYLRFRYTWQMPQFQSKYVGYSGNFHSLTIGIGVIAHRMKREL